MLLSGRSRRPTTSAAGSPPTCTTASSRTSRASRSASRRWPTDAERAGTRTTTRRAARVESDRCARACATCARCSSRSTRRAWSPPGSRRRCSDLLSPLRGRGHRDRAARRRRAAAGLDGRPARLPRRARGAAQRRRRTPRPTTVRVEVTRPEPSITRLVVTDDGRGFDADERAAPRGGGPRRPHAARGPRRASRAARSSVESSPGEGTTVELEVPAR